MLLFPGFDQKERQRTRGMNSKAGDPRVDPAESLLSAVSIAAMGSQ